MSENKSLQGKVAIVTGAASGIGAGIARVLSAQGASVVVSDIAEKQGAAVVSELDGPAVFECTDVTDEAAVEALVARAAGEFGPVDIMCNNAGALVPRGSILELTAEQFDFATALLLRSVFFGTKHAGKVMAERGSGAIVNTASTAGLLPGGGPHVYAALKAAVIHLTKSTSLELGEKGVRVNAVCPGGVATPLMLDAVGMEHEKADSLAEAVSSMRPLRRVTSPEDVGRAVAFLAGESAGSITGQALTVDAGEATGILWSKQGLH